MTAQLFREDSYLKECTATVVASDAAGIVLDRTVFVITSYSIHYTKLYETARG